MQCWDSYQQDRPVWMTLCDLDVLSQREGEGKYTVDIKYADVFSGRFEVFVNHL